VSELDGCLDLSSFGWANPSLGANFFKCRSVNACQITKNLQQALANLDSILSSHADTQEDGQEFGVAQCTGTKLSQTLAWSLRACQIGNAVGADLLSHLIYPNPMIELKTGFRFTQMGEDVDV
jgi:hypothetical protein